MKKGDKELKSDKDEVTEKDDLCYEGCNMPAMKGYIRLQTARRGTPYKCNPMGRGVTPRNLGNLQKAPGYLQEVVVEEQQYACNILANAEITVDDEVGYEDWVPAQGLLNLKCSRKKRKVQIMSC